jgi:acetyl esterase
MFLIAEVWVRRLLYIYGAHQAWKNVDLPTNVKTSDVDIPLQGRIIKAKLFVPNNSNAAHRPLIIYFHGGGMVLGGAKTSHYYCCLEFSSQLQCTLLSVDYRLAPEYKFPAGANDAIEAAQWVKGNKSNFPGHNGKVLCMGDSAGGYCALLSCLDTIDAAHATRMDGAILLYPVLESPDAGYESWTTMATGHSLTATTMRFFWRAFLGMEPIEFEEKYRYEKDVLERAFPLRTSIDKLKDCMPRTLLNCL